MNYRFVEELSLNHWPSLSTLLYDGWLLRFAEGYTKRANSIHPIYASSNDLHDKIATCENIYSANRLPPVYKITPFAQPPHLDEVLAEKGYSIIDMTSVQTLDLANVAQPQLTSVRITETVDAEWLEDLCRMNPGSARYKHAMERMLSNIRTKAGFITLQHDGRTVACGLGVIERDYIGLYDIVTDAEYRNRGYAEQMILNLLSWGQEHGAARSYLAVVASNGPAWRLYEKIGYAEIYRYWYRIKEPSN